MHGTESNRLVENSERFRYVLIVYYFDKWVEFDPFKEASEKAVADDFFDEFGSEYCELGKLISYNHPCFV